MGTIGLLLALTCPAPRVDNMTKTWVELDRRTFARAASRCEHYYPSAPCLVEFQKLEERRYRAICGKKR